MEYDQPGAGHIAEIEPAQMRKAPGQKIEALR